MLVQDETVGCISKRMPDAVLSQPHSASLIDLDGDCISDLFLTVQNEGVSYYEIYLRREPIVDPEMEPVPNNGKNVYCLVAREQVASDSVFKFADLDRDGMMDMAYITQGKNLNVHYNRLVSELKKNQNQRGISLFTSKDVCASPNLAVNLIKDMFTPPEKATSYPQSVMQIDLAQRTGTAQLKKGTASRPAQIYFGDLDSDGYPDLLATMETSDGKSQVYSLLN